MANRRGLVAAALLLVAAASLAAVLLHLRSAGSPGNGGLGRLATAWWEWDPSVAALPFSPADVLPLLPRGVAMAALRALRGASDIFPVFVGAATADGAGSAPGSDDSGGKIRWKGACFYENEAWLVFHNETGSKYGGGTVHIKVRPHPIPSSRSTLCNCNRSSLCRGG